MANENEKAEAKAKAEAEAEKKVKENTGLGNQATALQIHNVMRGLTPDGKKHTK